MSRKGGWRREGSRGRCRYLDARGNRITDADQLARIRSLVIPPAWRDVWISPSPTAKLQATGVDKADRRQYLYHADFRAQQDRAKFDRLILFAERLPDLRTAMSEHMDREALDYERVSAVALRLVNRAWFRVGTEGYAKQSRTFGITTLSKRHVRVHGNRVAFEFRAKHKVVVRTALVDAEIADAIKELLALREGSHGEGLPDLGRHTDGGDRVRGTGAGRDGDEPEACRRSGHAPRGRGTRNYTRGLRVLRTSVRRSSSSISKGERWLISVRDICASSAPRDTGLDFEEQSLLSLLRSWRIRQSRAAA